MTENLLTIKDLNVALPEGSDRKFAVQNINLNIKKGEIFEMIGPNG